MKKIKRNNIQKVIEIIVSTVILLFILHDTNIGGSEVRMYSVFRCIISDLQGKLQISKIDRIVKHY